MAFTNPVWSFQSRPKGKPFGTCLAQLLHCTEEDTEAEREEVTSSASHSKFVKVPDESPDFLIPSTVLISTT